MPIQNSLLSSLPPVYSEFNSPAEFNQHQPNTHSNKFTHSKHKKRRSIDKLSLLTDSCLKIAKSLLPPRYSETSFQAIEKSNSYMNSFSISGQPTGNDTTRNKNNNYNCCGIRIPSRTRPMRLKVITRIVNKQNSIQSSISANCSDFGELTAFEQSPFKTSPQSQEPKRKSSLSKPTIMPTIVMSATSATSATTATTATSAKTNTQKRKSVEFTSDTDFLASRRSSHSTTTTLDTHDPLAYQQPIMIPYAPFRVQDLKDYYHEYYFGFIKKHPPKTESDLAKELKERRILNDKVYVDRMNHQIEAKQFIYPIEFACLAIDKSWQIGVDGTALGISKSCGFARNCVLQGASMTFNATANTWKSLGGWWSPSSSSSPLSKEGSLFEQKRKVDDMDDYNFKNTQERRYSN